MDGLAPVLVGRVSALLAVGGCAADFDALDDAGLLAAQRMFAEVERAVQPFGVWIAAAIGRRSRNELGFAGLARRNGFVTAEALIQSVTGGTRADAVKFVQVGTMVAEVQDQAAEPVAVSWLSPVVAAVSAGELSLDAPEAIRKGLAGCEDRVASEDLRAAVVCLVTEAGFTGADLLFRRARELRDVLDSAGVESRQAVQHGRRFHRVRRRPDGMVAGSYLLDGEDGELMVALHREAGNPKRQAPAFRDSNTTNSGTVDTATTSDPVIADTRTVGQRSADLMTAVLRLGVDADPGTVFGTHRPAVRVLVTQDVVETRTGFGFLQDTPDPITLGTVDRHTCSSGTLTVTIDPEGNPLNLGRTRRLFTPTQRVALAVRDGGCRFPGCDRPVAWTEAHHIHPWHTEQGRTDLADGVLLCRHHHLLVHDNHWRIIRTGPDGTGTGNTYHAIPPRSIDPNQRPRPMPTKSRIIREIITEIRRT